MYTYRKFLECSILIVFSRLSAGSPVSTGSKEDIMVVSSSFREIEYVNY